ncbi:MAG: hypothetical protein C6W55_13855 [Thermobacillus sp.]|uniref:helix-turn-helix domain-containing protein n=1 Tax=Thermobacillus sp. TaxID=2108467 RepID=UPI000E37F155|nr:helix-turn-helix domain-containing protein [Thermobacillus sp.]REK53529.1 MAG: hypothetical protein C6W55_13855 [Thermobacillus sp.]
MIGHDLFTLVQKAKAGDKEAMKEILHLVEPFIQKACRRASPNEQNDLQQYLAEKVIVAVKNYDMNSIPGFAQFIELISSNHAQLDFSGFKNDFRNLVEWKEEQLDF